MICVWQNLGYTVILFLSGMINVSKDLYEQLPLTEQTACPYLVCNDPMLSGTTFFIVITSVINSFKVFE